MRFSQRIVPVMVIIALAFPRIAAADDGWQMPSLNPFAKKGRPPTSARVSDPGSSWKMPSFLPGGAKKSAPEKGTAKTTAKKSNQPTTWQKMTTSSRKFWNQTADTLNPFNDALDNKPPPSATGSNSYFSQASNSKSKQQKSSTFLPSWFSEEKEEKPKTVNEFLGRPRPGY
jgi:hypothetical protein